MATGYALCFSARFSWMRNEPEARARTIGVEISTLPGVTKCPYIQKPFNDVSRLRSTARSDDPLHSEALREARKVYFLELCKIGLPIDHGR